MFKGFFNRMYNGDPNRPDLDPGDMPKNRFELFFTTLGVRFGDLVKINLLFIVCLLPVVIWTILTLMAMNAGIESVQGTMEITPAMTESLLGQLFFYLLVNLVLLPLAGPPLAGMTYVVRNYARDEHAWLWSDFKEQMKKNWKQSAALMLILDLVLIISLLTMRMYSMVMATQSWMWIMQLLFVIFVGIFMLSYMYAFPMLVTYKLKLGQILRNSLMLALGRLPFTLIFGFLTALPLLLGVFVFAATGTGYALLALVIFYGLLGFSLASFIINSYTNATFDKLMRADSGDSNNRPPLDPEDREIKP